MDPVTCWRAGGPDQVGGPAVRRSGDPAIRQCAAKSFQRVTQLKPDAFFEIVCEFAQKLPQTRLAFLTVIY
jgi:hypothetical protein